MAQLGSKKSRRGCRRCKSRHVKCNEAAPCNNCIRRGEECSLLEPTPSTSSETADPALPGNSEEWIQDLELMHHYTRSTSRGITSSRQKIFELWRDYIPQQALKHDFLMHGLLALAALHLAYLHPDASGKYMPLFDKHQTIALKSFRAILSTEVDPNLADPLFALASTISVSSMARSCAVSGVTEARAMNMDDVTEHFFLTRGVRDVIRITYSHIESTPMAEMFGGHMFPEGVVPTLPDEIAALFSAMEQMLEEYGLDEEALKHCQSALTHLEKVYRNIVYWGATEDIEPGQIWVWQTMVTTEYVRLIQARCQPAIIIFAYWAAATSAVHTAWYTHNFNEYAIRGVSMDLDPGMQHWLEWPMRQVEDRMAILGVSGVKVADSHIAAQPLAGT